MTISLWFVGLMLGAEPAPSSVPTSSPPLASPTMTSDSKLLSEPVGEFTPVDEGPATEFTPIEARMNQNSVWRQEWDRWKWRGVYTNLAYIGDTGNNGFGVRDFELSVPFMRTLGSEDRALMFSPGFGLHWFDPPADYRLPDFVFDTTFDFGLRWRANDRWRFNLGVTPGIYADPNADGVGFRILGRALAVYQWSESLSFTLGAVYLDRDDIPVVPGIGFSWTPNDRLKLDANMPRPRLSYMIYEESGGAKWWAYTGASLGGGQWLVRRDGEDQVMTLRQFNLVAGIERRPIPYVAMFLESGWVFGREVEIQDTKETFIPSDSFIVRLGVGF